jgi:lysyl-tRNA synthetase class 1
MASGAENAQMERDALRGLGETSRAWPFEEARRLLGRLGGKAPTKGYVLFETGYGPSGLPHIGTFGEVARTGMVRKAFSLLSDIPTRLICFSDDLDGLRKVPDNVPNGEMLATHLHKPLTAVPDPFGTHESFGAHNNARLRKFLDKFGFDYEFVSATECYRSGRFDEALLGVLANYDKIRDIVLPLLGPERRATYSPFLPICLRSGKVLQVPTKTRNPAKGTITYLDPETGEEMELPVTGGHCKLQWRVDWAMRWRALDVDYEMSGKDLIDSVKISGRICQLLGSLPPEGFTYELFLDENGEKISKSRGNGIGIEQWLRYASPPSLSLYMYQSPRKAKRLYFDVIPKTVDEYISYLHNFAKETAEQKLVNPLWHIHGGAPPREDVPIAFSMLLNLVSASNSEDRAALWGFIKSYDRRANPANAPLLDELVNYAINYFHDFVKPAKKYRQPDDKECAALADLCERLTALPVQTPGEDIQTIVYAVGKDHGFENLREWFGTLYEVLLGQMQGPRFGSFAAIYGLPQTIALIRRALDGQSLPAGSG